MAEPGDHGFESLLHLFLTGGRDAREGSTMERVDGGDHLEPPLVVPELAGEFEQAFVGLGAAVGEETFAGTDQAHQRLGQPSLGLVIIEIRDVNQLAGLLHQRLGDGRVRMAQRGHRNAAAQVQVTLARHIVQITAGAVAEGEIKPPVARHHVLLEQLLYGRDIIPHDWRRRGHNFFHLFSESFVPIETGITP